MGLALKAKRSRRWGGVFLVLTNAAVVGPAACGNSTDAPAGSNVGGPCADDKSCKAGLYCAPVQTVAGPDGILSGLCTADCTGNGDCEQFGSNIVCSNPTIGGVCIKLCKAAADCP